MMDKCGRLMYKPSLGLLLVRVALGLVFLMHGWMKVHNADMVNGMFTGFGFPTGTAEFITWLEVIGGVALILGIIPRIFAILFGIEMLVAIYVTGISSGYQRHELEIVLALLSFGVAFAGSGRWSLFAWECRNCGGMTCKDDHDQSVPAHL